MLRAAASGNRSGSGPTIVSIAARSGVPGVRIASVSDARSTVRGTDFLAIVCIRAMLHRLLHYVQQLLLRWSLRCFVQVAVHSASPATGQAPTATGRASKTAKTRA